MGLLIDVMRAPGTDCTNGGITATATQLVVVNIDGPFNPSKRAPAVRLDSHVPGCLRLVPVNEDGSTPWYSFGGNYGATSDSRFGEACKKLLGHTFYGAVAIHDRVE